MIIQKTNHILNMRDNPFQLEAIKNTKTSKLFTIARSTWNSIIDNPSKQPLVKFEYDSDLRSVRIDENGVEILLTDLIENIRKYHKSFYSLEFSDSIDYFYITLTNDFKPISFSDGFTVSNYINFFDKGGNTEIQNKRTYGLTLIKSFIDQMSIGCEVKFANSLIIMTLTFTKY